MLVQRMSTRSEETLHPLPSSQQHSLLEPKCGVEARHHEALVKLLQKNGSEVELVAVYLGDPISHQDGVGPS